MKDPLFLSSNRRNLVFRSLLLSEKYVFTELHCSLKPCKIYN